MDEYLENDPYVQDKIQTLYEWRWNWKSILGTFFAIFTPIFVILVVLSAIFSCFYAPFSGLVCLFSIVAFISCCGWWITWYQRPGDENNMEQ